MQPKVSGRKAYAPMLLTYRPGPSTCGLTAFKWSLKTVIHAPVPTPARDGHPRMNKMGGLMQEASVVVLHVSAGLRYVCWPSVHRPGNPPKAQVAMRVRTCSKRQVIADAGPIAGVWSGHGKGADTDHGRDRRRRRRGRTDAVRRGRAV